MNVELENILSKVRDAEAGGFNVLSTGEQLVAALVLNRADWLQEIGYTLADAIDRVGAKWLTIIPSASSALRATDEALMNAAQRAKADSLFATEASIEVLEYNANLVTYGSAPGYRGVSLVFDVNIPSSEKVHRVSLSIDPADGAAIFHHIFDVHKIAWSQKRRPLDAKLDERKPSWINE
jgi:hypothetical protein